MQIPARILVVEDDAPIASDLRERLDTMGYEVAGVAETGPHALHLIQENQPDLILMDVILKGEMDGIQAATQIKTQYQLPIIFLTAHADIKSLNRFDLVEPHAYILKPYTQRELHLCIEVALYKHQADEKFRKLSRWLTAAAANNRDAVICSDLKGRVVFLNPSAELFTGWTLEEALGQPLFDVFHVLKNGRRRFADDHFGKIYRDINFIHLSEDSVLKSKNGEDIMIDDNAAPIWMKEGPPIGGVVVFRDASFRKCLEHGHCQTPILQPLGKLVAALDSNER